MFRSFLFSYCIFSSWQKGYAGKNPIGCRYNGDFMPMELNFHRHEISIISASLFTRLYPLVNQILKKTIQNPSNERTFLYILYIIFPSGSRKGSGKSLSPEGKRPDRKNRHGQSVLFIDTAIRIRFPRAGKSNPV